MVALRAQQVVQCGIKVICIEEDSKTHTEHHNFLWTLLAYWVNTITTVPDSLVSASGDSSTVHFTLLLSRFLFELFSRLFF